MKFLRRFRFFLLWSLVGLLTKEDWNPWTHFYSPKFFSARFRNSQCCLKRHAIWKYLASTICYLKKISLVKKAWNWLGSCVCFLPDYCLVYAFLKFFLSDFSGPRKHQATINNTTQVPFYSTIVIPTHKHALHW